jgi:tetratricopeptide (TPR) repeat protein
MRKANKLLNSGHIEAALVHYNHFVNFCESSPNTVRGKAALQSGVIYRKIGRLEESIIHLQKALLFMEDTPDSVRNGVSLRETGITFYLQALKINQKDEKRREEREDLLDESENHLTSSIHCLERVQANQEKDTRAVDQKARDDLTAEIAVSKSTWGLVKFERGEKDGRGLIEEAAKVLTKLGLNYEKRLVYTLIQLMRVMPLPERYLLFEDEVYDRTSKGSPSSKLRRSAHIALFGTTYQRHRTALALGVPGWK